MPAGLTPTPGLGYFLHKEYWASWGCLIVIMIVAIVQQTSHVVCHTSFPSLCKEGHKASFLLRLCMCACICVMYHLLSLRFVRFLKQADWNLLKALELMTSACEWHSRNRDNLQGVLRDVYMKQPGLFSLVNTPRTPHNVHCFASSA